MAIPGKKGMVEIKFAARGHEKISARDPQKIIVTKEEDVFDDSVIGVGAELAAAELPEDFKTALRERKKVTLTINTAGIQDKIEAFGTFDMKLADEKNIVFTKSDFADPATVGVRANKSAADLLRNLVELLQVPGQEIVFTLRVMKS